MTFVYKIDEVKDWQPNVSNELQRQACQALENGQIIFLPHLSFAIRGDEHLFLSPQSLQLKAKNISFNPNTHELRGIMLNRAQQQILRSFLVRFAQHAKNLLQGLLPNYTAALINGRTSFRPAEVSNRKTSYRKDDKRLHVDAFPANPNQGKRIVRVFSNINPFGEDRVWRVGEPFATVAQRFLPQLKKPRIGSAYALRLVNITKSLRSEYDHLMLQLHDKMKADERYQQQALQTEIRFSPATSWIVQTDQVSHAALQGRYVLEQTFYLPVTAMLNPQLSPLKILENLTGRSLV